MDPRLRQYVEEVRDQGQETNDFDIQVVGNHIRVMVECEEGGTKATVDGLESLGVIVETTWKNLIQCLVLPESVSEAAGVSGIQRISLPLRPFPDTQSEALPLINATSWHAADYFGAGVKVGILDSGFAGYASLLGSELPGSVSTLWAPSFDSSEGTSNHGTACAELVHDVAPGAQLYLANFYTVAEYGNAVDWFITQGVDVISCSIAWLGGPRDGTGSACEPIADARDAGIVWSQSAGNDAQNHWMGTYVSGDDGWHRFAVNDYSNAITLSAGTQIDVFLNWDDPWGSASNDYDLYVFYGDEVEPIAVSQNEQSEGYPYPIEYIPLTADRTGTYHIMVYAYSTPRDCDLELFVWSQALQYQTAAGSLSDNAASPDALTVGAVDWSNPGVVEFYSSQGPTQDGRVKPDIAGPDWVSTQTYGPNAFGGTSASAPHVAGAAALVKQVFPSYDPDQIQAYLETRAYDLGAPGKDNVFGAGRLLMPAAPALPNVVTDGVTAIGDSTATGNGSISQTGGEDCDTRGFCWSTSPEPSVADSTAQESGAFGSGAFDVSLTSLVPGTIYYARAYARNSVGYGYGEDVVFTTLPEAPSGLSATADGPYAIDLTWTKGDGATWTHVKVKDTAWGLGDDRSDGEEVYDGTGTSWTHAPLQPNTPCFFRAWSRTLDHADQELWSTAYDDASATTGPGTALTPFDLVLAPGWHMVSIPLDLLGFDETERVFGSVRDMYGWSNGAYEVPEHIVTGHGYMVAVDEETTISVLGLPEDEWTHDLAAGWNLIGSMWHDTNVNVTDLQTTPSEPDPLQRGHVYYRNGTSYDNATVIEPGKAYWLAASGPCTITAPAP